ncbi:elongation factor 1-gamma [Capronia epimyces CBS 606.96]|uniref:Elongation factor 1-gamma n=1 Tax=Capronia epimyces CBS 606.96 TaxID=1182542 RepID=W9XCB3_9EURO|nr:elongation factor 1-gamma [Capronia epimyces CBS 606.96]EXJ77838.1 elongation factor 1-gamma [Capronia epimyces CBS 606.96]
MSFGKLYGVRDNPRTTVSLVVAKENNLDVELVAPRKDDPEYRKLNPLGKFPTFVGADGDVLTESIAIAIYFASQNEKTTLLGKTKKDYAAVIRWLSFSNTEVFPFLTSWFRPLIGAAPYDQKTVEEAKATALPRVSVLEQHLSNRDFLVGDHLTLADLYVASQLARGFQYVLDKAWRAENPHLTRWYQAVTARPAWRAIIEHPILIDEAPSGPLTK